MLHDRQNAGLAQSAADHACVRRFDPPDDALTFDKGRLELITVDGHLIGKGSYLPGWRWSQVATLHDRTGGQRREHVGVVLTGRAKFSTDGQPEQDLAPGDFFCFTLEHDVWVVGHRPCEILYVAGVDALVARLRASAPN